ncbi:MAG: hypothetical protein PHG63_03465 [Candidatus Dojkabacteria bacterium]|nr:hypothetical protein [Candidatus Dojkabacteria bacterium]
MGRLPMGVSLGGDGVCTRGPVNLVSDCLQTYNSGMSRRYSKRHSSVLPWFFAVAAGVSAGYFLLRSLNKPSNSTRRSADRRKISLGSQPSYSVRRTGTSSRVSGSRVDSVPSDSRSVSWIPGLRVREQRILNAMPLKKEVRMAEIIRHFPNVTVRTLRRDMDRLISKRKVRKAGTTRSTTYVKV